MEMVYKELVVLKVVQVVEEQQLLVQLNLVLLEDPQLEDTLVEQEVQVNPMILQDQLSQLLEVVVELVDLDVVVVEVVWQEQLEQSILVGAVVEVLMEDQQVQEVQVL